MIYFIQQAKTNMVKIGYTGKKPENRVADLQTGNPNELQILKVFDGDKRLESLLHMFFFRYAVNGEWFSFPVEVLQRIMDSETPFHLMAWYRKGFTSDVKAVLRENQKMRKQIEMMKGVG